MRLLILVLALSLASPALAGKKSSSQKIHVDNKAIDSGMKESGQKADISHRTPKLVPKESREDRKIAR